jgi:hypothetical protein
MSNKILKNLQDSDRTYRTAKGHFTGCSYVFKKIEKISGNWLNGVLYNNCCPVKKGRRVEDG